MNLADVFTVILVIIGFLTVFVCIWLDAQHRAIRFEEPFKGTLTQTSVHPRDIVKAALACNAAAVIFALKFDEPFRGTLTQTSVYPREVVKMALQTNAAAVIFAHNHPSGVAQPSQADELLTHNLRDALALIEVKVLDHFIIAGNQAISFAERGLL